MTNQVPSLLVALTKYSAVVKVNGRANFTTSISFKRLINELRQRGFDHFILDLGDCVTMDSTFLGVLAGTALTLQESANGRPPAHHRLPLLNPNQRVTELLDNLGVSDLFRPLHRDAPVACEQDLQPATELKPNRVEISKACLEAHQLLMELNPENIPRFKDVTQFLAEDLKKLEVETGEKRGENQAGNGLEGGGRPLEACVSDSASGAK